MIPARLVYIVSAFYTTMAITWLLCHCMGKTSVTRHIDVVATYSKELIAVLVIAIRNSYELHRLKNQ